jgi:ankyrin repeat protein
VSRILKCGLILAAGLGLAGAPAGAQQFSDSYNFIKAVKDRNGGDAERLLANPSGAVINARDGSGEGAVHILTRGRDLNWLTYMLGKGARPDLQNRDGMTALAIAAQLGWIEGAGMLLRAGASVDMPNNRGETPLIFAVQNRDVAMTRLLMGRGANPKRADSAAGYSALDYAKRDPRAVAIVRILEAPAGQTRREVAGPKL